MCFCVKSFKSSISSQAFHHRAFVFVESYQSFKYIFIIYLWKRAKYAIPFSIFSLNSSFLLWTVERVTWNIASDYAYSFWDKETCKKNKYLYYEIHRNAVEIFHSMTTRLKCYTVPSFLDGSFSAHKNHEIRNRKWFFFIKYIVHKTGSFYSTWKCLFLNRFYGNSLFSNKNDQVVTTTILSQNKN